MKKGCILLFFAFGISTISTAQCDEKVRVALGGVSAIALYNTYLAIGVIGDAYSDTLYKGEKVQQLMNEQMALMETMETMISESLDKEVKGLTDNDKKTLGDMMLITTYLKAEARGLYDISLLHSDEAYEMYNSNRTLAWDKISALLQLKK